VPACFSRSLAGFVSGPYCAIAWSNSTNCADSASKFGLLRTEEGEARADQRAQDERQEEAHEAGNLPNDVARAIALLLSRQQFMDVEAEESRSQRHKEYENRNEDDGHENAVYAFGPLVGLNGEKSLSEVRVVVQLGRCGFSR
jgi:hypothetical protein